MVGGEMSACPDCLQYNDDHSDDCVYRQVGKLMRERNRYREALEKIAATKDTGGAEGYFGGIAREALHPAGGCDCGGFLTFHKPECQLLKD